MPEVVLFVNPADVADLGVGETDKATIGCDVIEVGWHPRGHGTYILREDAVRFGWVQ